MKYDWYQRVEEPLRYLVKMLRDNGINTECACAHEMYIQCQCLDPTGEMITIYNVLAECGIDEYQVIVGRHTFPGCINTYLTIYLPDCDGNYAYHFIHDRRFKCHWAEEK